MSQEQAVADAKRCLKAEQFDEAWRALEPMLPVAPTSHEVAMVLLEFLEKHPNPPDVEGTLRAILEHATDPFVVYQASRRLLAPADGRHTDDPYGDDDPSFAVIPAMQRAIAAAVSARENANTLGYYWSLLGDACRYAGPDFDEVGERAYGAALALEDRAGWRFDLGLLYNNRGRWLEGVTIYKRLLDEGDAGEAVLWNLGICATGAGQGRIACEAWTKAGFDVELGDDGLPRMEGLGMMKLRLSTGTLRERCARRYENVWAMPVSPCHGRVLNPTMYDHGYEIGDLVLWDGAPIGRWRHGENEGNLFAALGKLAEGDWRTFAFRGRQTRAGQMQSVSEVLPNDSSVYVFDEQVSMICAECARTGGPHTDRHTDARREATLVSGKLVLCPRTSLPSFVAALEAAIAKAPGVVIACPDLYRAVENPREAERHERLLDDLGNLS
jgi:hypothetical protein